MIYRGVGADEKLIGTVLSIKASFRSLENSGNFLEHKVSRSRTRILGQLLAARHAALEETPLKPVLPTMPWSTPRMDSRPTAVVYAKARADQEAQRVESRPLKVTLQEVDSDAESDCSDSSSDISKLDLEARAAELAEPDWPGRSDRRRNSGTAGDDESQSENSQDLLLEEEESPAIARSARGSIASSIAAGVSVKASSVGRRPSTAGNAPSFRRGSFAKARESRPRPTTKMQLRVQTNRPFSAPRMRCDVGSDAQRPGTAPAVRRTSTPRTPATPRQKVGRPVSAATPPARPKSAFTYARRPQSSRSERPPLVPHCQPQARWMAGAAAVAVNSSPRRNSALFCRS